MAVRNRPPPRWYELALEPARAFGDPPVSGSMRVQMQDFIVEEQPRVEPDGGSAHVLLRVEKTGVDTLSVARALARHGGVRQRDVGFAGLKDRRAVAVQWFSVPAREGLAWPGFAGAGFRVLEAHPHSRKLRRGALAGNRFRIRVRGLRGDPDRLAERIGLIAQRGVPNYFGPQRFGAGGANLERVHGWTSGAPLPRGRESRAFVLSTARALCFNAITAARVKADCWERLLDGEVVSLTGSASVFAVSAVDESLRRRCETFDVHPTGGLPGRAGLLPAGEAAAVERAALAELDSVVQALVRAAVEAARRPLRLRPDRVDWALESDALDLSFDLPAGAFATAVLRELVGASAPPGR